MMHQKKHITISKEELGGLPAARFKGNIHVVDNGVDITPAIDFLSRHPLVGFDTETKPTFRKGEMHNVALLQISTGEDCFLFRLNLTGLTPEIAEFLENPAITKIGLSLHDDFHNLRKLRDSLSPGGFIDLQTYVNDFNITDKSLTKIYAILFGKRISKGQRLTNWEAESLSPAQQDYAALDAQACLDIYDYLRSGAFKPELSKYLRDCDLTNDNPNL